MSANEVIVICFAVLCVWNIALTITLFFNGIDRERIEGRLGRLNGVVKENQGNVTAFSKELMGYLGLKLITWKEKVVVNTGEWYGPICKEMPRYAIVSAGVSPGEIDKIKNPPEED